MSTEHIRLYDRVRCVADVSDPRVGTVVGISVGERSNIRYRVRWDGETSAHPFAATDLERIREAA